MQERDSGMDSDYSSDMTSITSSNYLHTIRGSRRYFPGLRKRFLTADIMVLFGIRTHYRTIWKSRSGWTNNILPCHLCLVQIFSSGYVVHFESSMSVPGQVITRLPSGVPRAELAC